MSDIKPTRKSAIEYLNELGVPEHDKRSNGGRVPDACKYGNWLMKNDPTAFNQFYNMDFPSIIRASCFYK